MVEEEVNSLPTDRTAPRSGSVEHWCWSFIVAERLGSKLDPEAPPDPMRDSSWDADGGRRLDAPGRPPELRVVSRSPRSVRAGALARVDVRARLMHTFMHHELQAAELFAWAVLAFSDAPRAFRRGLLGLCLEELAHFSLYRAHLARLGHAFGDFEVRDWFWERVRDCESPAAFVSLVGVGLEGANLEHTSRFAARFRDAGDEVGARILERVEREEVAHVAFAVRWFERLTGKPLSYERWCAELPSALTPSVLRGRPLNEEARLRAGLDQSFLTRLAAEPPSNLRRVR